MALTAMLRPKDFVIEDRDEKRVITGLSPRAKKALVTGKNLWVYFPDDAEVLQTRVLSEYGVSTYGRITVKSWGGLTTICSWNFAHREVKLPPTWGNISDIEEEAFYCTRLISRKGHSPIPGDWGEVTSIGKSAFFHVVNDSFSLPSRWGKVSSIGGYAFSGSNVESIPDNWGEVSFIGAGAFSNNSIESLPESWGKVRDIQQFAFERNHIRKIHSWDGIDSLGKNSFCSNNLSSLPTSWGNIKEIPERCFARNSISHPPAFYGVSHIDWLAFQLNGVKEEPLVIPDDTDVDKDAFSQEKHNSPWRDEQMLKMGGYSR